MKKPQTSCVTVLTRLAKMCEEGKEFAEALANYLDTMLDEIQSQDGFGTEAQSDPRGDFRNGRWTIKKIEPVSASAEQK